MQNYLNELDENLVFLKQEKHGDCLWIFCESKNLEKRKVHSRVERVVKDINYGEYKVELHILWKKYFVNSKNKLTESEKFSFIGPRSRRTKRLDNYLLKLSKEMSAIGCERLINKNICDVSDSTLLRIVKKNALS